MILLSFVKIFEISVFIYLSIGFALAIAINFLGVFDSARKLPELATGSLGFRWIVFPSLLVLWPWIAKCLLQAGSSVAIHESNASYQRLRRIQTPLFLLILVAAFGIVTMAIFFRQAPRYSAPPPSLVSHEVVK